MATKTKAPKSYEDSDIRELSEIEAVRIRLPMYLGSRQEETFQGPIFTPDSFEIGDVTFIPALLKAYSEVIDNSVDELLQGRQRIKTLSIDVDEDKQTITVADNGRGIPIGKRPSGRFTPEVVLTKLHSGRNFIDDDKKEAGVIGQNGVGVSATNICSSKFQVTIRRDGKKYTQTFLDGTRDIRPPKITEDTTGRTGTEITFTPDPTVFKHTELPMVALRNRAYEVALVNPDITVTFNGERIRYKKGLPELASEIGDGHFVFEHEQEDGTSMQFVVLPDFHEGKEDIVISWVNSSLVYDGGICNTQFMNSFIAKVQETLEYRAKKAKIVIDKDDVKRGLLVFGNLKVIAPEYDSQAKTRLKGPTLKRPIEATIENNWASFSRKNKEWFESVFQRTYARYHHKANKQAQDDHAKTKLGHIEGLLEATHPVRSECILFITEGDSAKASIRQVRDPIHGAYAMTGKFNNVLDSTPAQVLAMEKIKDVLKVIGLTPGVRFDPGRLRYGRIYLAMDADVDGAHITTLFVNLFYRFWPEMFNPENPYIFRLVTPNVVAYKGNQRIHFPTLAAFNKVQEQYESYGKKYMKGLGSLTFDDWRQVLNNLEQNTHTIIDDGKLSDSMQLHFGKDVAARKQWLMGDR